jgi:hypothetical protein
MKAIPLAVALLAPVAAVAAQARWVVDSKPTLDVRDLQANGTVNFQLAAGATRLENGSLLVADQLAGAIRLIDATGILVKTSGKIGDGPGEFSGNVLSASRCGSDSLIVWDRGSQRVSMIGASGVVARQFRFSGDSGSRGPVFDLKCTSSGRLAYLSDPNRTLRPTSIPRVLRGFADVVTADRDGLVIGRYLGSVSEWVAVVAPRGGNGQFPRPLGVASFLASVGNHVILGVSDSARVVVLPEESGGAHLQGQRIPPSEAKTVSLPIRMRVPRQEEFDDAAQAIAARAPNQALADAVLKQLLTVPMSTFAPAYSGLFEDPEGLLWVQLSTQGAKDVELLAIRLDGYPVARIRLPVAIKIYEIGGNYILGSYSDANDAAHVALWKLTRK